MQSECNWNERNWLETEWELGEILRGTALWLEIDCNYWQTNPKYYQLGQCINTTLKYNSTKFGALPISWLAMVAQSLYFTPGPGDMVCDIGHHSNFQGWLACSRNSWKSCFFEAGIPTCTVGVLKPLINVLCDCQGSRNCSALSFWGPVIPPMLNIYTKFGANPRCWQGCAVAWSLGCVVWLRVWHVVEMIMWSCEVENFDASRLTFQLLFSSYHVVCQWTHFLFDILLSAATIYQVLGCVQCYCVLQQWSAVIAASIQYHS